MSVPRAAIALLLTVPAFAAEGLPQPGVTVHEWGTFTSVAGLDGNPVPWEPLASPTDLPCFVLHGRETKSALGPTLVRMETPVLYFYASRAAILSVKVAFPHGRITEWYPKTGGGTPQENVFSIIEWNPVEINPGGDPVLPTAQGVSHYFAARATDASPIRVDGQDEKMIFYRGLGSFAPPVRPQFTPDGRLEIRNTGPLPIPSMILFENRGGRAGYRPISSLDDRPVTLETPALGEDIATVRAALGRQLVQFGLYEKEAAAMLATWRDSWFEEGMRVFYFVPRASTDSLLHLTINPKPSEIERVFVGRVEVLSPAMRSEIETALHTGNVTPLKKYGRFLEGFLQMTNPSFLRAKSPAADLLRSRVFSSAPSCVD